MSPIRRLLRRRSDLAAIRRSGRFATDWYRATYCDGDAGVDPLRHYCAEGAARGHAPHPLFDPRWYRARYADVGAAGVDPFVHYVTTGTAEGRDPNPWFDRRWYAANGGEPAFEPLAGAEAAHPRLSRRFTAADAAEPLRDLADFLHRSLARDPVGMVELRTPQFVSGWIAAGSETASPEIVVEGRVGTATLFNPRPDVAALIGRPAHGFLFAFEPPLAEGQDVVVRLANGGPFHGSPYRQRPGRAPDAAEEIHVHFDSPTDAIRHRLVELAGWIRLPFGEAGVEIRTDGTPHHVFFGPRTDVIAQLDDPYCVGFMIRFDAGAAAAAGRDALDLAIVVDGRLANRRTIPFALAPLPAVRAKLDVFMHIPKTAGISISSAIKALPDARALWLYDRGAVTIADQIAALSPAAIDELRLVGGHFMHGIDRQLGRPCAYVAFLREPASYVKSFYLFMKYVARAPAFAEGEIFDLIGSRPEFDNAFVRWFAAVPDERTVGQADLDRALATLEGDFAFVGLVERMGESVARLSALWGVDLPVLQENKTPPVAEAARIDPRELAHRAPANIRYDTVLVERAKALFWT